MLQIDAGTYFLGALLTLILPPDWLLGAFFAAAFHELCHIITILCLKGRIFGIRIGFGEASIETDFTGRGMEIISAAVGPLGSLSLLVLYRFFPELAISGLVQGLYNLLPIYPLDGGRILRCCLEIWFPEKVHSIETEVQVAIILMTGVLSYAFFGSVVPAILGTIWILRGRIRKRPCKRKQIGVQ